MSVDEEMARMKELTEKRLTAGDKRLFPWSDVTVDSDSKIHWNIPAMRWISLSRKWSLCLGCSIQA